MHKGGANKKRLNLQQLRKIAQTGATQLEIASKLNISVATLQRRAHEDEKVRAAITQGKNDLFVSLRAKQVEEAMKGNIAMLIWLGKQYLGQQETVTLATDALNPLIIDATASPGELLASRIAQLAERRRADVITIDAHATAAS